MHLAALLWCALPQATASAPALGRFVDVSAEAGIRVNAQFGPAPERKQWILEVNGGGVGLFDGDGDGDLDVWLSNGSTLEALRDGKPGAGNTIWRQAAPLRFEDATKESGAAGSLWGNGVAIGDVDNDGDLDVLVAEFGPERLFVNDGKMHFTEVGEKAGLVDPRWSSSAAFVDADADGVLDLFVGNYLRFDLKNPPPYGGDSQWRGKPVMRGPRGLVRDTNSFYRGVGLREGLPIFVDRSEASGIAKAPASYALGVTTLDFDDDGDSDIFVANDSEPYFLFVNDGKGNFTEKAEELGCALGDHGSTNSGMGVATGDLDGDGRFELAVTNFSNQPDNIFQFNGRFFSDRASILGIGGPTTPMLGWGCRFLDADLNGWLDLFIANSHVYPEADLPGTDTRYAQGCQLFLNQQPVKRFLDASAQAGLAVPRLHRGAAFGDLDGDGDEDVIISLLHGAPIVLRNDLTSGRAWLALELRGTKSNRSAVGARVRLTAGGRVRVAELQPASSFQSSNEPCVRFGLGDLAEVDEITIRWPSGAVDTIRKVKTRQRLVITEGSAPQQSPPEK